MRKCNTVADNKVDRTAKSSHVFDSVLWLWHNLHVLTILSSSFSSTTTAMISSHSLLIAATVSSAEAESICLKNGLLFHEILASFGNLDGINAICRTGTANVRMSNVHLRFERASEMQVRSLEMGLFLVSLCHVMLWLSHFLLSCAL